VVSINVVVALALLFALIAGPAKAAPPDNDSVRFMRAALYPLYWAFDRESGKGRYQKGIGWREYGKFDIMPSGLYARTED
jgi:hypothetical protein